jgi:hypothetical protein
MAHPTGFEPVTSAFGARCVLVKGLKNIAPNTENQQERIKNITALSGNNPEEVRVLQFHWLRLGLSL